MDLHLFWQRYLNIASKNQNHFCYRFNRYKIQAQCWYQSCEQMQSRIQSQLISEQYRVESQIRFRSKPSSSPESWFIILWVPGRAETSLVTVGRTVCLKYEQEPELLQYGGTQCLWNICHLFPPLPKSSLSISEHFAPLFLFLLCKIGLLVYITQKDAETDLIMSGR